MSVTPIILGLAGAGAGVAGYAALLERNWFALRYHTVPCLPPGAEPLRVLHISDLHLRAVQRRKQAWLRDLARVEPDLVVGTGDFLGDDTDETCAATVETLAAIPARVARLFVLGSNDYYGPVPKNPLRYLRRGSGLASPHGAPNPWRQMVAGLEDAGWCLVNNRALEVDGIDVIGMDDAHIGKDDPTRASVRAPGDERFRLAIAHSPDSAPGLAAAGYDLIVCGHTHGGQVCVPGFGALVTNCSLPRQMASGLHRFDGAWLHVNAGLGTSMYAPYRIACRPEACVLELVPRDR